MKSPLTEQELFDLLVAHAKLSSNEPWLLKRVLQASTMVPTLEESSLQVFTAWTTILTSNLKQTFENQKACT